MHRSAPSIAEYDSSLVDQLMRPAAYSHPVTSVERIETHISWILLTDEYVYKIKKPLDLGFLDFGTLDRRRHYCEEEIRLNKPWAPDIYIDVVPIVMSGGYAQIGGDGAPVEYAVRMKPFDQEMLLDRQLLSGNLSLADATELGDVIARRHLAATVTPREQRNQISRRAIELILENFEPLQGYIDSSLLDKLQTWTTAHLRTMESSVRQRFDDGFFRDCHGDLHLGNLVRLPTGITTFDCIEFNDELRNIDVVADYAFLTMDLVYRERKDLAAQFLNRYLEVTGDYDGVRLLNLYFSYRCLVRAKIDVLRSQERKISNDRKDDLVNAERYCQIAAHQVSLRKPMLIVMHGLSASGKTFVSDQILGELPAIRIRSDIERKRLFNIDETGDTHSAIAAGIYATQVTDRLYKHLHELADALLQTRHSVILDASFLRAAQRKAAHELADRRGVAFVIVETFAPDSTLRRRLRERMTQHLDASEADTDVLEYQLRNMDPLSEAEAALTIRCNSENLNIAALVADLRSIIGK